MTSYYFERYHKIAYKNILPIAITSKYACFLHILTSLYYLLNFCHLTIILIYTLIIGGIEHIFTYWTLSFFWELSINIFCGSNYLISCKAHQAQPNNQMHMIIISHVLHSRGYRLGDSIPAGQHQAFLFTKSFCSTSGISY